MYVKIIERESNIGKRLEQICSNAMVMDGMGNKRKKMPRVISKHMC